MITATLSGLTFSNDYNAVYSIEDFDGWFGAAPVKDDLDERPAADGAFGETQFYRTARPVTISGKVHAPGDGFAEWRTLAAVFSSGTPATLTVDDGSIVASSVVRPIGSGLSLSPMVNGMASYVLSLIAYDPVKQGPTRTLSTGLPVEGGGLEYPLGSPSEALFYGAGGNLGRVFLSNAGTAKTFPTFKITGGLGAGFFIQRIDTGQVVRYDRVVPAGTDVTVDMRTGSVVIDGTSDGSTYLSRAEFFGVEPGPGFDVQFNGLGAVSGTPTMTATIRDGFW